MDLASEDAADVVVRAEPGNDREDGERLRRRPSPPDRSARASRPRRGWSARSPRPSSPEGPDCGTARLPKRRSSSPACSRESPWRERIGRLRSREEIRDPGPATSGSRRGRRGFPPRSRPAGSLSSPAARRRHAHSPRLTALTWKPARHHRCGSWLAACSRMPDQWPVAVWRRRRPERSRRPRPRVRASNCSCRRKMGHG